VYLRDTLYLRETGVRTYGRSSRGFGEKLQGIWGEAPGDLGRSSRGFGEKLGRSSRGFGEKLQGIWGEAPGDLGRSSRGFGEKKNETILGESITCFSETF
jgi:hypothetical protein